VSEIHIPFSDCNSITCRAADNAMAKSAIGYVSPQKAEEVFHENLKQHEKAA
jgi:hypothetical protein